MFSDATQPVTLTTPLALANYPIAQHNQTEAAALTDPLPTSNQRAYTELCIILLT